MVFSMDFIPNFSSTPICGSESTLVLPLGLYWTNSFSWNNSPCLGRLQCFTSWCLISDDFSCHLSFSLSCCCLSGSCPSCHSPMLPGPPLSLTRVSKIYLINSQWPLRRFRYDCNLPDCLLIASSYTISTDLVFQLIIWIAPSRWVALLVGRSLDGGIVWGYKCLYELLFFPLVIKLQLYACQPGVQWGENATLWVFLTSKGLRWSSDLPMACMFKWVVKHPTYFTTYPN